MQAGRAQFKDNYAFMGMLLWSMGTLMACGSDDGQSTSTPTQIPSQNTPTPASTPTETPTLEASPTPTAAAGFGDPLQWELAVDPIDNFALDRDGDAFIEVLSGASTEQTLYLGGQGALFALDPTDPSQLLDINTSVPRLEALEIQDDLLVGIGSGQILLLDIEEAGYVGRALTQFGPQNGYARGLAISGDGLYITALDRGLIAYDIGPGQISGQGLVEWGASAIGALNFPQDVAIHRGHALVTDDERGLVIFDVTNPRAIFEVAELAFEGSPRAILIHEEKAYITLGDQGLAVVDIFHLDDPQLEEILPIRGAAYGLSRWSDTLCVASQTSFELWDITENAIPHQLAHETGHERVSWCGAAGDHIISADRSTYGIYTHYPHRDAPEIHVETHDLVFDAITLGESTSAHLTLYNDGNADLEIHHLEVEPWAFSAEAGQFIIAPQSAQAVTLTYTAVSDTPAVSGQLSFFTNDPDEAQFQVPLSYGQTQNQRVVVGTDAQPAIQKSTPLHPLKYPQIAHPPMQEERQ